MLVDLERTVFRYYVQDVRYMQAGQLRQYFRHVRGAGQCPLSPSAKGLDIGLIDKIRRDSFIQDENISDRRFAVDVVKARDPGYLRVSSLHFKRTRQGGMYAFRPIGNDHEHSIEYGDRDNYRGQDSHIS